jgi:hypothetical protein
MKPKSDRRSAQHATCIACQNMKPESDRQLAQQATSITCQDIKPKSDRQSTHKATINACQEINSTKHNASDMQNRSSSFNHRGLLARTTA